MIKRPGIESVLANESRSKIQTGVLLLLSFWNGIRTFDFMNWGDDQANQCDDHIIPDTTFCRQMNASPSLS